MGAYSFCFIGSLGDHAALSLSENSKIRVPYIYLPRWYSTERESLRRQRRNRRLMHALGSATLVAAVLLACLVWAQPSLLKAAVVQDGTRWLIATAKWGRAALGNLTSSH